MAPVPYTSQPPSQSPQPSTILAQSVKYRSTYQKRTSLVAMSPTAIMSEPAGTPGPGGTPGVSTHTATALGLPRSPAATAKLDDISRRVREQSDRLQRALTPIADGIKVFADTNPVIFTFLAIFAALSFIPVACFVGFVVAATVLFSGTAVFGLCLSVAAAVFFAGAVLLPVLIFTGTMALLSLCCLLGLFLAHRLYLHLTDASAADRGMVETVSTGVRTWFDETRSRVGLGPHTYRPMAFEDYKAFDEHHLQHQHQHQHGAHTHRASEYVVVAGGPGGGKPQLGFIDYAAHHPQPTPSHPHAPAQAHTAHGASPVTMPRIKVESTSDLFTPQGQSQGQRVRAADTTAVKRESDDSDWESEG